MWPKSVPKPALPTSFPGSLFFASLVIARLWHTIQVDSLVADFPGSLSPIPPISFLGVVIVARGWCSERSFRSLHAKLANSFTHFFFLESPPTSLWARSYWKGELPFWRHVASIVQWGSFFLNYLRHSYVTKVHRRHSTFCLAEGHQRFL